MLSEKKKKQFQKLLNDQLEELLKEPDKLLDGISDPNNEASDFTDQATMESEMDFSLHLEERKNNLMIKIREALERLEQGTYDICQECEEEIGEKRLEARPMTTLCIDCKQSQEKDERLRGF